MKPVVNDIQRGPLCNCIALHDFRGRPTDIKDFFHYSVALFESYGLAPTRMGMGGEPYRSKKTVTYQYGVRALEKNNYQQVETLSLYAHPPDHGTDMFDWIMNVVISFQRDETYCVISFDDRIIAWNPDILLRILDFYSGFLKPQYGYGYQRLFKKGPSFFPMGVCVGTKHGEIEEDWLTRWDDEYFMDDGTYKTGDLRDIFPLNILSQTHKERTVDGIPLFDWIQQDPDRGRIIPVQDVWAWFIDLDKVDKVRDIFIQKHLLLCVSPEDLLAQPYT